MTSFNISKDKLVEWDTFKKRCIDLKTSSSKRIMLLIEKDNRGELNGGFEQ